MKKLLSIFLCLCVLLSSAVFAVNADSEKISPETREKIAENSESLLSVYIFLQVDFNRSEVEKYVLDNVEGAKTDANIFLKYYREEVVKTISPQVQKFVDDNEEYLENIEVQGGTVGLVVADVYAYNIEKIAQYDRVTQINYSENKPCVNGSEWIYENKFIEQYDIDEEKLTPGEYSYSELYYHLDEKEEVDWVLVDAFVGCQAAAETTVFIGNGYGREIFSGNIYYPFETRYGVYDVKEEKFYDIKDYQNVPDRMYELISVLKELNIGVEANVGPTAPAPSTPKVTSKKANPIKVTAKTKTVKAKKLKKKAQTVKAITVKNAQGKVTVTKVKKGTASKIYKKITVNKKTGAVTLKKGSYAKKTYKIKLKIKANGNASYNAKTILKTIRIKVN